MSQSYMAIYLAFCAALLMGAPELASPTTGIRSFPVNDSDDLSLAFGAPMPAAAE